MVLTLSIIFGVRISRIYHFLYFTIFFALKRIQVAAVHNRKVYQYKCDTIVLWDTKNQIIGRSFHFQNLQLQRIGLRQPDSLRLGKM